jgi:hypothetical protein
MHIGFSAASYTKISHWSHVKVPICTQVSKSFLYVRRFARKKDLAMRSQFCPGQKFNRAKKSREAKGLTGIKGLVGVPRFAGIERFT